MTKHPIHAVSPQHLCRLVAQAVEDDGPRCDLNHIDVSRIQQFKDIFAHSPFDGDISQWDVSNAVTFENMFFHCPFNGDISQWNVSHVLEMNNMFKGSAFCGDVSSWDTANLRQARGMFESSAFNGNVSGWNARALTDARSMFCTPAFHGDLSAWVLRSSALHEALVHPTFCGVLPTIEHYDMHDAGAKMLGGVGPLNAYALRAPFGPTHAHLLLAAPERCSWASREEVRWAREMREMGRAMGLNTAAIQALMVEQKRQSPTATTDGAGHLFECN